MFPASPVIADHPETTAPDHLQTTTGDDMDADERTRAGDAAPQQSVLEAVAAASAAQMSGENFPVALRLLPRTPREHLARVYGFARFVDDVGDEAPGDRLALLDLVERDVRELAGGHPQLSPVAALQPVITACAAPLQLFLDLVEANRVDQTTTRYATFADLLDYCRLSANPVGRIVLHVAGAATEPNLADSDAVCSALQVLEHCQDVAEDAAADRIYLPEEDLRAAGVTESGLRATTTSAALRSVVATQVDRSAELLASGRPLVGRLSGWARIAVAGYVAGGLATAARLRKADYDVLPGTLTPSKAGTAARALVLAVAPRARWIR